MKVVAMIPVREIFENIGSQISDTQRFGYSKMVDHHIDRVYLRLSFKRKDDRFKLRWRIVSMCFHCF